MFQHVNLELIKLFLAAPKKLSSLCPRHPQQFPHKYEAVFIFGTPIKTCH